MVTNFFAKGKLNTSVYFQHASSFRWVEDTENADLFGILASISCQGSKAFGRRSMPNVATWIREISGEVTKGNNSRSRGKIIVILWILVSYIEG